MRALILLGLLQAPPEILTRGTLAMATDPNASPLVGIWYSRRQQAFRVVRSNGDLMTSYHPCGCIEVGLGEGIALLPCSGHRKAFLGELAKEEK